MILWLCVLACDETLELAQWWTTFQEVDEAEQHAMVKLINNPPSTKSKRRRKPKTV